MNKRINSILWGVLLILCAGVLVASQLGLLGGLEVSVWKVLFSLILLVIAVKSVFHRNFAGILFPIAIFCIMFDEALGITALTPWTVLLVALLLSIALSLIFKNWCGCGMHYGPMGYEHHHHPHQDFSNIVDEQDGEVVHSDTTFSATVKYVNTDNFKKAYVRNSFGETKMYFDKALIQDGPAEIQVSCSFGEIQLFIPKNWKIIDNCNVTFAGVEEKNHRTPCPDEKEVYLTGGVSFGAVVILYV